MKKAILITFLLIAQFAISQNEKNGNPDSNITISTGQESDSPFHGKINRRITKLENGGFDESKPRQSTETSEARLLYKDSSVTMNKRNNRNESKGVSRTDKEIMPADEGAKKNSGSIESNNSNMKISSGRTSGLKEN